MHLSRFFYNFSVRFYFFIIRLASVWNPKAKLFVKGRKNTIQSIFNFNFQHKKRIWFHFASLGEFEQGLPLMEQLKETGDCHIVITFFSPSGYEIKKNYSGADLILYLPIDTPQKAKYFFDALQPTEIFYVKYEFWANYLFEAKKRNIPTYLISAVFRKNQIFFKFYGGFMRKVLKCFDVIFVQNQYSQDLLKTIHIESSLAGDTRFDRVLKNAENKKSLPLIENFLNGEKCFVIGSCWEEDEKVLFPYLNTTEFNDKIIIAPHLIDEKHIQNILNGLKKKNILYSKFVEQEKSNDEQILIIDNIGMLMHIYQYAEIAYIGGAFKTGLHNILEPACFGVPVIFGNKHQKFHEAQTFIENGIGFEISNTNDFIKIYQKLKKENLESNILDFMTSNKGATELIMNEINSKK